ncbi:14726_t:CDS:2 [Cetraspora pellucida]|uniref:14726_t:CDS:1 n=1 Tax=Cetraspora pellucida TaxID=1433469 RepID=A0A9N9BZY5_9GLOM|nr:14726_t:CDS:2 [Cetraspora pellucida]
MSKNKLDKNLLLEINKIIENIKTNKVLEDITQISEQNDYN